MPSPLTSLPVTNEQRQANDTHQPAIVVAVLVVLFVYMYLFTHIAEPLGIPLPKDLVAQLGVSIDHVFDSDRNVDSTVQVRLAQRFRSNDDERLVLYLVIAIAFLCAYFLPLEYKQLSLTFWTTTAVWLLYGSAATAGLLLSHLTVYLVLHPRKERYPLLSALLGVLAYLAFVHDPKRDVFLAMLAVGLPVVSYFSYRYMVLPLLEMPRIAPVLRTVAIQSAILTVCVSALIEGVNGAEWSLPLGLLLFFWQWERLIMYHVDYKDGLVPENISIGQYLAVFWNPGVLPNWNWGVTIGQGYAYVNNNFLCEDKNKLVLSGLKLWLIALGYIVFGDWFRHLLVDFFTDLGIPVYRAYTKDLVRHFTGGGDVSTVSVLLTTLLDLIRWTMLWAGIVHFKVGIWRVCGYRVDPYIHRPWAATNLSVFWSRFTFHYREFLIKAFYYPVFFRFFKKNRYLRVFVATMAAAAVGNMVWGHVTERLYYRGMEFENIMYVLGTWPFYVFLGVGISVSQLFLLRYRGTRKPWTWDRWIIKDVIAAYCTVQFFALIHIFARPSPDSTVQDLFRLFLIGFGVNIPG